MYSVVPNPKRAKVFSYIEKTEVEVKAPWSPAEEENLKRMGIQIDDFVLRSMSMNVVTTYKAIGYCKNKSLAKQIKKDVPVFGDLGDLAQSGRAIKDLPSPS